MFKMMIVFIVALGCFSLFTFSTQAETVTFTFAPVGNSYSAALFGDDPIVGHDAVSARIYLTVESFAGSDAANFFTDILFPIEPLPGNESALVLSGSDLNWSGAGRFEFFEETTRFNGRFVARRFGAETPGENFAGVILDGRIEFDVPSFVRGDFDGDLDLDALDIDLLSDEVRFGSQARTFDLNQDSIVDQEDRRVWVEELKCTYFGDATLDGQFNSGDLVAVFQAGQYEDAEIDNSTWATGDWDGSGDFETGDLVLAFQSGGFERGPREKPVPVPEMHGPIMLSLLGIVWLIGRVGRPARLPINDRGSI
jgi:hypothetical protein